MLGTAKKFQIESLIHNFRSCCRFLKITEKDLYYKHLQKSGVQIHYSFKVFQTMLADNPTCIYNKYPKVYNEIVILHETLIVKVHNELRKYMH